MNAFDAIYCNNVEALRYYLQTGDVNIKNERGMGLLHYAIMFNNQEIFDMLLENYADVNIQDSFGDTPVIYCIVNNRMGFLKNLLSHGANLKLKNKDGQSALFKACNLGREEMIYLLLETLNYNLNEKDSKKETIFMALIRSRNLNLLEKLPIDDKVIDDKNYLGETPLHIACRSADSKIVKYLLEKKAFVNIKNNTKETPLFYAIESGNTDVIDILLRYGAIPDCRSTYGETVFDLANPRGLANYLSNKIDEYNVNKYKANYPLHYAIIVENFELVKAHANIININKKDSFGFTPLDLANKIANERIVDYIKENL